MTRARASIETVRAVTVFANEYVSLHNDEVVFADGTSGTHVRITTDGQGPGVMVVPYVGDRLGLVRVYRYPLGAWQWGFPRGFAHSEDPLQTARAELGEEIGLKGDLNLVGWFTPDSGVMSNRVAVVLALADATMSKPSDTREVAEVEWLTLPQIQQKLGEAPYDDGMTMAALALLSAKGLLTTR